MAELPQEVTEANLLWKCPLPARGVSGPIVVGDRVFVTSSGGIHGERMFITCVSAADGSLLWNRSFAATGRPFCHPTSANAAPTPCTDGERIYAFFSSNDLVCLDLDGNLVWFRGLTYDFPQAANDVGMSASPVVHEDRVVVQVENQGDSFAMALDKHTGVTSWRRPRPRQASWSSPLVCTSTKSDPIVLFQSMDAVDALRLADGEVVWNKPGPCNIIPSITRIKDLILTPQNGLSALRWTDAEEPEVVWESKKFAPGSASPIAHGDDVYVLNRAGVLMAIEASSGKQKWQARIGGQFWSTPVAAGDRMYLFDSDGRAKIAELSNKGKIISTWELGEPILGSPAMSGDSLYVRGDRHLWRIGPAKDE